VVRIPVSARTRLGVFLTIVTGCLAAVAFTGCTPEANAELRTIAGVNAIRTQNGLPPLVPDAGLFDVARIRSRDMAGRGYFSHSPPDGCNYVCLMDRRGVGHAYAGENIAWNTWDWRTTADVAVDMWRKSPPHLENILNCHYTRVGAGVSRAADGRIYYTMVFEGNGPC
jgi:uncharacterized protein YkwD